MICRGWSRRVIEKGGNKLLPLVLRINGSWGHIKVDIECEVSHLFAKNLPKRCVARAKLRCVPGNKALPLRWGKFLYLGVEALSVTQKFTCGRQDSVLVYEHAMGPSRDKPICTLDPLQLIAKESKCWHEQRMWA